MENVAASVYTEVGYHLKGLAFQEWLGYLGLPTKAETVKTTWNSWNMTIPGLN